MSIIKNIKKGKQELLKKKEKVMLSEVDNLKSELDEIENAWEKVRENNNYANDLWADLEEKIYELKAVQSENNQIIDNSPSPWVVNENITTLTDKLNELGIDIDTVLDNPSVDRNMVEDFAWNIDAFFEWSDNLDKMKLPYN